MDEKISIVEQIKSLRWWGEAVQVEAIDGGITNHNFKVTRSTDPAEKYVVRICADIPVHHISRLNEVAVSRAAHEAGLSPGIRHHEPGVLIMDYIDSRALTPEEVAGQEVLERILPVVIQCHQQIPDYLRGAPIAFWVFHVIRDYIQTLKDGDSAYQGKLNELLLACNQLEKVSGPYDIVFGHNDLLSANFLDDGEKIWLIDWEYAGYNTPLFDIGGLVSNNDLTEQQERWLLLHYFDREINDELWRRYQAMKTASLLRETLWSMVSEIHSTIEFDYSKYTAENYANFKRAWSDFNELLS